MLTYILYNELSRKQVGKGRILRFVIDFLHFACFVFYY